MEHSQRWEKYMWLILWAESTACWLIFVTFTISVMISIFGFGRQQVICYLFEFLAFKYHVCHVFVIHTSMMLSAQDWPQSLCSYTFSNFGAAVHSLSDPIAERRTSYQCTTWPAVCTCPHNNYEIPQVVLLAKRMETIYCLWM